MYTEQDFWRDYPPKNQPFAFPWEAEYHQRVIEQVREEVREEVRDEVREEERKTTARTMRDLGLDDALITKITGFTPEDIRAL